MPHARRQRCFRHRRFVEPDDVTIVEETMTWADFGAALKTRLGITGTSQDEQLFAQLRTATRSADAYMSNPFEDEDGDPLEFEDVLGNPLRIPPEVIEGVFVWVATARGIDLSGIMPGTTSVKTGDLSQGFSSGTGAGLSPLECTKRAAAQSWATWKGSPWR